MPDGALLAGAYTVDVTPPEGVHAGCWSLHTALAEGAHDRLEVTALVLADGTTTVALVGVDACMVSESAAADARRRVTGLTGIPAAAVLINASHDHAAPRYIARVGEQTLAGDALDQYALAMPGRIAGAVYGAYRRLQPARVGFGTGRVDGVSVNRVDRTQPVDDSVWVLTVEKRDGEPLAAAVSFACHPVTIGGQTRLWDTDYPGPLRRRLRAELGVADCLFLQGAAGDVAPWDFWFGNESPRLHCFETRDDLADAIAAEAVRVAGSIEVGDRLRLAHGTTALELQRRRFPWSLDEVAARAAAHVATPEDEYPELWADTVHTATSAQRFPDYYQKYALILYRGLIEQREVPVPAELQAVALGDQALIANPFEPFTDVGAMIAGRSPFAGTRVLGYTNGYAGYLPPPADYAKIEGYGLAEILDQDRSRWAYGITTAWVGPEASAEVVDASVACLERLG